MAGLVKHYQNDMQGIPQLTNAWGCMINLLDAVLITGFNFRPVLGLSKASTESLTATISLATGHGFIARQVVRIKDSTNGWNGDFKVLSVTASSITVECLSSHPTTISGTAQIFTSPLDWEIVFSTGAGSAEPKRAYRSTHPNSLGLILLVHDFCVSGAAATGAKFAKVGLVSSMSDINTITGTQMPFDGSNPNANWGWDGTYHGWAKWYYKVANGPNSNQILADSDTPDPVASSYTIIGDDLNGFAVAINRYAVQNSVSVGALYGFFEFDDLKLLSRNAYLMCFGVPRRVPQSFYGPLYARGGLAMFGLALDDTLTNVIGQPKGLLWFDKDGLNLNNSLLRPPHLDVFDAAYDAYASFMILDTSNNLRGILPFVRASTRRSNTLGVDAHYGKYRNEYYFYTSSTYCARYFILMESV
jgi:hypothetical protein